MKARLALSIAAVASMALLGCGKDDPVKPPVPPPSLYPDRSTPKNTLLRMVKAFETRDSVVTASVYADDYEGRSTDLADPSPETLTFSKADEIQVVAAMAMAGPSITDVRMEFYSTGAWSEYHYISDPPGWTTIQIPAFRIEVHDMILGDSSVQSPSAGEIRVFEFTLKPTTPDPASPTDTTWTIVRWMESRSTN